MTEQKWNGPGGPLAFDLIAPDDRAPLVILIHGGGWISGEKESWREEAAWYANNGFATACITYRLAPLYPFPAAVADCQSFLRHIKANADQYKIDPDNIAVLGNSAGGHLATMMGLCKKGFDVEEPAESLNAVVNICGITDLTNPQDQHFDISLSFLEQFMGGSFAENPEGYSDASPVNYVTAEAPPMLIIHGDKDDVVPCGQSLELHEKLKTAGSEAHIVVLHGEGHSFTLPAWEQIRERSLEFFTEHLK